MRYLSLLLLIMVISSFVLGAAEGACSRTSCSRAPFVDTVEWLGAGDLGMDLGTPDLNANEPKDLMNAEPVENNSQNETGEKAVDEVEIIEEIDTETTSGVGDRMDLILTGDVVGKIDLTIFRSGDVVFGTGNLTAEGAKSQVGASGSASGDQLVLNLVPLDESRLYVLDLDQAEGSIRGSYEAYNSDGRFFSGMADSTLFA
ncbi:MAG TPA: hypothetical protein HA349_02035 [Methanotrichaceae archaeon]|nr:hypothetical protein [Methanotrichaceae archaeon]